TSSTPCATRGSSTRRGSSPRASPSSCTARPGSTTAQRRTPSSRRSRSSSSPRRSGARSAEVLVLRAQAAERTDRLEDRLAAGGGPRRRHVGAVVEERERAGGAEAVTLLRRDGDAHARPDRRAADLQRTGQDVDDLVLRVQVRAGDPWLVAGALDAEERDP